MDSNNNPITNAGSAMPPIPSSPAPEPVIPTPSDAMPSISEPVDNTPAPEPATSSVPTFSSANPAANAAPVVPTTSSTPTSFGMNSSSYDTGYNTSVNSNNGGFDSSSVASFFTPETPSYANGGIIAATEPITEPDPIPEPDPIEQELNAPFKAAAPVPGSIGSAVSVPKDAPVPAAEPEEIPAAEPAPVVDDNTAVEQLNVSSPALSAEPITNPNNPFLAQNNAPVAEPAPAEPTPVEPAPMTPATDAVPVAPEANMMTNANMAADPSMNPAMPAMDMQSAPAPGIPQFDPNMPLPMPGDVMPGDPMQAGMVDPMMQPAAQDMPFAYDSANNQMNPFAEAAALNADPNAAIAGAPEKAKDKKKLIIICGAAAALLLVIILLVVMMAGGKPAKTGSTEPSGPVPEPEPELTSGTTVCTRKFTDDEYVAYTGSENGTINVNITYEDNLISGMSIAETIDFDNETNRKSGLRTMKNNYNEAMGKYSIVDDTAMSTEYVRDILSITGTRKIEETANLDAGIVKLFGIISTDGKYIAEDTIAGYEEKGYTCKEKGGTSDDEEEDEEEEEVEEV